MMPFKTLIWKVEDGIGHLVLNQPPANAMTGRFFEELHLVTHGILPHTGIRALVVYGNGRHFSSGADLQQLRDSIREAMKGNPKDTTPDVFRRNTDSFSRLEQLPVPAFAAIRGICFGSALELALVCRYRICAEGAVLGFPESSFGLMPGCGGTVRLPAITGRSKAVELILGGRNFSAEEALEWGIVHKIVPGKDAVGECLRLADSLSTSPPYPYSPSPNCRGGRG